MRSFEWGIVVYDSVMMIRTHTHRKNNHEKTQ